MKRILWMVILSAISAIPVCISAQSANSELSQGLIRKGFNTPYLNFGGYGMLLYQYNNQTAVNNTLLKPRVVFLWMEGKLLNDKLRYFIMPELVSGKLYEYYAEWTFTSAFKLKAGQFKVPFTLENPISLVKLESVQNTRTVAALSGMSTDVGVNNGGGRDIGIQASGSFAKLGGHDFVEYAAGVFQGTGINLAENNNVKDFAGTLALQPVRGWRVACGMYAGQAYYSDANHVRNRWTIGTDYTSDRLEARAEYLHGNDGGINRGGAYATATYYVSPKKISTFAKFDHYNSDTAVDGKTVNDYSLGLNYYFAPLCRIQLNYQYSDFSKNYGSSDNQSVNAELQLYF